MGEIRNTINKIFEWRDSKNKAFAAKYNEVLRFKNNYDPIANNYYTFVEKVESIQKVEIPPTDKISNLMKDKNCFVNYYKIFYIINFKKILYKYISAYKYYLFPITRFYNLILFFIILLVH